MEDKHADHRDLYFTAIRELTGTPTMTSEAAFNVLVELN